MDLDLLKRGFDTQKNRKWILLLGALGFTGYGAYKVYNLPSVAKKRERLSKLLGALFAVGEMVSDSAEAIGIVSRDVKEFILSDSDQIPNSLKQISKVARSDEMWESLMRVTCALTVGFSRGNRQEMLSSGGSHRRKPDFSDRILDKLFTEAGAGFASVIVGSFSKNFVLAYYSSKQLNVATKFNGSANVDHPATPKWADVLFDDKCRELIADCVQMFVSTAVAVFLDKTMHINTYDEFFSGLTNPKHEAQVKDMLSSICNDAVETLVRSTHQVFTNAGNNTITKPKYSSNEFIESPSKDDKALIQRKFMSFGSKASKLSNGNLDSGWMRKMPSTLAAPNHRRFILDVTGRVTFETVRSFLEFLLEKITVCMRRSVDVIHEEVIDRGIEVVQHVSRTSSAVVSICLSLCLHILNGPWILVPTRVL